MKTFLIATGGIRVGQVVPLELATDGLLELAAAPEDNAEVLGGVFVVPHFPRVTLPRRKDAVVEVTGVRAVLTCTAENVAAGLPTMEDLDRDDDLAFLRQLREERRAAAEEAADEAAYRNWAIRFETLQGRLAERERRKKFKKELSRIKHQVDLQTDAEAVLAMAVGLALDVQELRRELEALKNPKPSRGKK